MRAARPATWIVALLVAATTATACAGPAADVGSTPVTAPSTEPFHDDFDDPSSLEAWQVSPGQQLSGGPAEVSVVDGHLRVVSAHAAWLDQAEAFGLVRTVSGDVDVTARVRTTGKTDARPDIAWSLAGVMLRDPAGGPADWIHWTVGEVGGPVLERKRTSAGHSILELVELPDGGPVDLRMIRSGDRVVLAYRQGDGPWAVAYDYAWVDMPRTLDLLITAQSGGVGDHADLVAYTDFVDVTATAFDADAMELLTSGDPAPLNA